MDRKTTGAGDIAFESVAGDAVGAWPGQMIEEVSELGAGIAPVMMHPRASHMVV